LQAHNPKIVTDGLIYHLDPTNGQKGEGATVAKPTDLNGNLDYPGLNGVRCELWLDASDLETIVHSSNSVSNWLDKSGEGSHAAEGSNKPTLVKGGWNGLSYLSFDGSNDQMTGALGNSITHDTMFVVCQTKNSAGDAGIFYIGSSFVHKGFTHHNAGSLYRYFSSGSITNTISMTRNVPHIISSSYYSGAGDLFCDGVANTGSSGTPANPSAATAYVIGNASAEIEMYLAEIIVYNTRLTAVDRKKIERYLSLKWDIPLAQRQMRNLADGVSMPAELVGNSNGAVCVTHRNTLEFRAPGLDDCDLRLEANEITIADNLPWTIEFWIKRHARGPMGSATTFDGVWGNTYASTNYERLTFNDADEDKLMFVDSVNAGTQAIITNSADIDCLHKWRHVVIAFDGTTDATTAGCVRQYVDGSDKGSTLAFAHADSKITVRRLGSRGNSSDAHRLEGELGNFRVYDKQLSHAEVLQNYNAQRAKYENKKMSFAAPDNLKLYLDADSGTSTNDFTDSTWYDLSGGTAHNATRANATMTTTSPSSLKGNYYDLDGTGDYFSIGSSGMNVSTTAITVAIWVSFDAIGDDWLVSTDNGTNYNNGYILRINTGGANTLGWYVGTGSDVRTLWSQNVLSTNNWYYVVATDSMSEQIIYVDGTVWASGTATGNIDYGSVTTGYIGAQTPGTSLEFNGQIANVMIYDTVLSADQIVQNYNYFKHRFGK
jgi:hypothetical protein